MTGKGKVVLATSRRRIGGTEECLHLCLTSELDGELMVNFTLWPALPTTQKHGYPLNWWLGGPQGRSGRFGGTKQFSQCQEFNCLAHILYLVVQYRNESWV